MDSEQGYFSEDERERILARASEEIHKDRIHDGIKAHKHHHDDGGEGKAQEGCSTPFLIEYGKRSHDAAFVPEDRFPEPFQMVRFLKAGETVHRQGGQFHPVRNVMEGSTGDRREDLLGRKAACTAKTQTAGDRIAASSGRRQGFACTWL